MHKRYFETVEQKRNYGCIGWPDEYNVKTTDVRLVSIGHSSNVQMLNNKAQMISSLTIFFKK